MKSCNCNHYMGLLKTNIKSALNRSNCVLVKVEIQNLTELNDGRQCSLCF